MNFVLNFLFSVVFSFSLLPTKEEGKTNNFFFQEIELSPVGDIVLWEGPLTLP